MTGTSSVPFEGFKALRGSNGPKRFTIDFFSDVNSLPRYIILFIHTNANYSKSVVALSDGVWSVHKEKNDTIIIL